MVPAGSAVWFRCNFWDIDHDSRPLLRPGLPPEEFDRWYWLAAELRAGATALGIPATGRKQELAERIRCALAGAPPPAPVEKPVLRPAPKPAELMLRSSL